MIATRVEIAVSVVMAMVVSGCASLNKVPKSLGELQTSYSYIPLDPLPVTTYPDNSCKSKSDTSPPPPLKKILSSLPDQAVRIAVGQYDASGTLVFGPAKTAVKGNSYQVVLDYISVDTTQLPVYIERLAQDNKPVSIYDTQFTQPTRYVVNLSPDAIGTFFVRGIGAQPTEKPPGEKVIIPVYVGVGLRLTASVTVLNASANLSSLGTIAADAQAGRVTGSLVVQTLGITGSSVATAIPLPSELNPTTIQNAILSLGSIKAILYDPAKAEISPRVVGIYNPVGGGQQVVNGIISILASSPVIWYRPCQTND